MTHRKLQTANLLEKSIDTLCKTLSKLDPVKDLKVMKRKGKPIEKQVKVVVS